MNWWEITILAFCGALALLLAAMITLSVQRGYRFFKDPNSARDNYL